MKKFNLEKALAGEKVVTHDGIEVTELHFFASVYKVEDGNSWPLVAIVDGHLHRYTKDGKMMPNSKADLNLFMASVKHKGWINVYRDNRMGDYICTNKEGADLQAGGNRIACIEVEFEEGEGL